MELNDQVSVKLTKDGAIILNEKNNIMNEIVISHNSKYIFKTDYKENDVIRDTLWTILDLFKDNYKIGSNFPFTNLKSDE